jgi:hypothetical protein
MNSGLRGQAYSGVLLFSEHRAETTVASVMLGANQRREFRSFFLPRCVADNVVSSADCADDTVFIVVLEAAAAEFEDVTVATAAICEPLLKLADSRAKSVPLTAPS